MDKRILVTAPINQSAIDFLGKAGKVELSPSTDEETLIGLLENTAKNG